MTNITNKIQFFTYTY